jgi:hypothetical protein
MLLSVDKRHHLSARDALITEPVVNLSSNGRVAAPGELQTGGQRHSILQRLCGSVPRGREERVCTVANLDYTASIRCPIFVQITPSELPVDETAE